MNVTLTKTDAHRLRVGFFDGCKIVAFVLSVLVASGCSSNGTQPAPDVRTFAKQHYIHGLPFSEARLFTTSEVPILRRMLADDGNQPYWPNIVALLGFIGGEQSVNTLIEFQNRSSITPVTVPHLKAKLGVLLALGYAVYTSENSQALAYLRESVQPGVWEDRAIEWRSPFHASQEELHLLLTEMAVIGLGFTAEPSASAILRNLIDNGGGTDIAAYNSLVPVAKEALETHRVVTKLGLEGYYRRDECLPFSADNAAVTLRRDRWKLTQNGLIYADFGSTESYARRALEILRTHEVTEQCYIGLPEPQMQYFLAKGQAPSGSVSEEDCTAFASSGLTAKRVRQQWHVLLGEGRRVQFSKRDDAERAIGIIRRFGFDRFCTVGDPTSPSLMYWVSG